ncbi:cysteine--tRNA ligase [Patescibacteria group bacterium]|nr:cysteine--tRNA ligase [Patescibacteria group bacterium]
MQTLQLYNTLTRKKEEFKPIKKNEVGLYTCGPTVYNFAHIGNLRSYIFEDILKRVLIYDGYKVKHIENITDVGHLTSDADEGEDKMQKAAQREKKPVTIKTMMDIADKYTKAFISDIKALNISEPDKWAKATDHIKEMIDMNKKIVKNGYAYTTSTALYFDTSKLKEYSELAKLDLSGLKAGARVEKDKEKKNHNDFALWFKAVGKHKDHVMVWESPWGTGFPGWHLECSAMSIKYLGEEFDIHCGGIDHIPVHHTNERAQNIAATGSPVVKTWCHGEFLVIGKSEKMAKSGENFIILETLVDKGYDPLSYRYLALMTHYRKKLQFTWENLDAAQIALKKLYTEVVDLPEGKAVSQKYLSNFEKSINDDLNTPQALALVWGLLKDKKILDSDKKGTLIEFDKVLGLGLDTIIIEKIPADIKKLADQRQKLRQQKKWNEADNVRQEIEKLGYQVEDTKNGPKIIKN